MAIVDVQVLATGDAFVYVPNCIKRMGTSPRQPAYLGKVVSPEQEDAVE